MQFRQLFIGYALLVVTFLSHVSASAQNMVANGSFEQYKICPGMFSQTTADFQVPGWESAGLGIPDYFNYCSRGEASVPYNWAGVSEAYEGDGYVGLYLWMNDDSDYREYLRCALLQPLITDSTYYIEFHYKLSSYSNYSIDRIGLNFSSERQSIDHDQVINLVPALGIIKDSAFTTTTGMWEAARFEYKAKGSETVMTIGNFYSNRETKNYKLRSRVVSEPMLATAAYYFIDFVIVVPKFKIQAQLASKVMPGFSPEATAENTAYVLKNLHFKSNSAALETDSFEELDKLASYLALHAELRLEVSGHTDDVGLADYNLDLSAQRSKSVASYLVSKGIAETRIVTFGFGESQPLLHGQSGDARSLNRRVEVKFIR